MNDNYIGLSRMDGINNDKFIFEKRVINSDNLILLCKRRKWYTLGSEEEFFDMWYEAENLENVTTYDIFNLAKDIWLHSDLDVWKEEYLDDEIKRIMFLIERKACHTYFSFNI